MISFDYNNVIARAKELDNIASAMQGKTYKEIEDIIKNIEASWSGDSAKLFIVYLTEVATLLKAQSKNLNLYAEHLRTSAQKMKQAESAASSAVNKI